MHLKLRWRFVCWCVFLFGAMNLTAATPVRIEPISVALPDLPATTEANGDSFGSALSADGRYVFFTSFADNLTTNLHATSALGPVVNVFRRDRVNRITELVSVALDRTAAADGDSYFFGASADGRFALFSSAVSNLVTNDTRNATNLFVRDLVNGLTKLVSVNASGSAGGNGASTEAVITPDGRFVAFTSEASNLAAGDTNQVANIFVRDLQLEVTTWVSVRANGARRNPFGSPPQPSSSPAISSDGNIVAFVSSANNIVTNVANYDSQRSAYHDHVYVRNLRLGTTLLISPNDVNFIADKTIALSANGNAIAFRNANAGLVGRQLRALLYWSDLTTGLSKTIYSMTVTARSDPAISSGNSDLQISTNGQFVCYVGRAAPSDERGIYVWDAANEKADLITTELQTDSFTQPEGDNVAMSADGNTVAFVSMSTNLVTLPIGEENQVFVRDRIKRETKLVSVNQNGTAGSSHSVSAIDLSVDGRVVAIDSFDADLVANDNNDVNDVFVRDLTANTTEIVSTAFASSVPRMGNAASQVADNAVSADGRFVVFTSTADNLTAQDQNGVEDVFVRDLELQKTILVSSNTNGVSAKGASYFASISANGRYVLFASVANDLVTNDTNSAEDVFVRDLQTQTTTLVSISHDGIASRTVPRTSSAIIHPPRISSDGRFVAFISLATDLASPIFAPQRLGLYLRDLVAGTTALITDSAPVATFRPLAFSGGSNLFYQIETNIYWSASGQSAPQLIGNATSMPGFGANGRYAFAQSRTALLGVDQITVFDALENTNRVLVSTPYGRALTSNVRFSMSASTDGRFITFVNNSDSLSPLDTNGAPDVYVIDRLAPEKAVLISVKFDGSSAGNGISDSPRISADGRYVVFRSTAADLVAEDTHGWTNLFMRDLAAGTTSLIVRDGSGIYAIPHGDNRGNDPISLGQDGRTVVFSSTVADLVNADANNHADVFYFRLPSGMNFAPPSLAATRSSVDGKITLHWTTAPGVTFRVQFKHWLEDSGWQDLEALVVLDGKDANLVDESASALDQRYYRLISFP